MNVTGCIRRFENSVSVVCLAAMAVLPLLEIVTRKFFNTGVPGSIVIVQHLTLVVAFLGAALAAREGRLLNLATTSAFLKGRALRAADIYAATIGAGVSAALCYASYQFVRMEWEAGAALVMQVKRWMVEAIMPVGLALVTARLVWRASDGWAGRLVAALGVVAAVACWFLPEGMGAKLLWPLMILLLAATALGAPVFVMMGGAAMLLFWSQETPVGAVPVESYRLVVSPTLPTIPLFTLAGYILAEGGASHRLVRLFRAWFGWFPGGTAVVAGLVCAFFTTFTGGSGVTILALGGLLLPVLLREKFGERFSLGLLTSAGSLGLLFPPSLPVILYGIVSKSDIINLFIAGFVPGCLILLTCAAWAMREGIVTGAGRAPFDAREARAALWEAKWEILLPVVVLVGIFGGFATLVEAAAISALYAFTVECLINRDLKFWIRRPGGGLPPESGEPKDLPEVITECATLLGGVLIILGVALGLTSYIVDAEIPARAAEWTRSAVHSQLLFLLGLNFFLLIVGMLMDIFSATIVVVPIITPIGLAFGVDPVHLGIVFLANLELGFLTPPVGMNLFLAAYRFDRPLPEIYRSAMPWMILRILCVLIITYVPAMTTGVLHAFGR